MNSGSNTVTLQATDTSGNVATKSYSVNVTGDGATQSYDANGNLSQKVEGADTWSYEWTAENELKRVLKNAVEQARYAYDPRGRRVEKVAGGVTTTYAYDEDDLLREQTSTGTNVKYIHSDVIDEPLAKDLAGAVTYFHLDGLSSVVNATDGAGAVTGSYRYDVFGSVQQGVPSPFGFTGREPEGETGLVYMRARYYDPGVGRFLGEDPAGLNSSINLYAYVDNSPANFTDPLGLIKTSGCTAAQAQAIDDAAKDAQQKLSGGCACPGGGGQSGGGGASGSGGSGGGGGGSGGMGQKLSQIITSAKYICKQSLKGNCAKAPLRPFGNRIYVSSSAFQPNLCGPLSCTLIHEATHRTQWFFGKNKEKRAQDMEKQCCGL